MKAQASKFYTHVRRGVWRFQDEFKTFSKSLDEIFTETKSVAQQDLSAIPHSETDIAVLKNQSEQLESAAGKIDRVRTSVLLTSGDEAKYYESVIAASKTILQNNPNTRMNTVGQHKELIREHGEPDIESSKICKACLICSATDQCNCYGPVEDRPSEVFGGQILTLNGALGGSDQVPTVNVGANSVEGSDLQRRKNDAMPRGTKKDKDIVDMWENDLDLGSLFGDIEEVQSSPAVDGQVLSDALNGQQKVQERPEGQSVS